MMAPELSEEDLLLLRVGQTMDGAMADDWTPDTLATCERLVRYGLMARGEMVGTIRVYHTVGPRA